jgi:hypothetical protein
MEPVEMFDSALAGTDRQTGPRRTPTVEPGTYQVRAAYVEPDPEAVPAGTMHLYSACRSIRALPELRWIL